MRIEARDLSIGGATASYPLGQTTVVISRYGLTISDGTIKQPECGLRDVGKYLTGGDWKLVCCRQSEFDSG